MSNILLANAFPRISARTGQVVDLNVDFLRNGILTDPFAIRYVEIYKTNVAPHNLVATIPVVLPDDSLYPTPVYQEQIDAETGACGTEPTETSVPIVGKYHLLYSIPTDFQAPDVYFDLWYYFAENPCGELGTEVTECNIDDEQYDPFLLKCCHRFWLYPDGWFCNDNLQTVRFAFEPLDQKFHSPEIRPLEVGLMPLPLYDYNFNLVNPLIPFLRPTISVETQHYELLVDNDSARMGIRQGSYRSNPWVIQYDLDTTKFLKGTYRYWITLTLPDGSTRVSRKFIFTIS
jgi:hypothetical protein